MMRQFELVDKVSGYLSNLDENLLNQAYVFTVKKHGDQKRASGDPYFSHPVEVAGILTELKLDEPTNSKRLGILSTQSSTVTRAILKLLEIIS